METIAPLKLADKSWDNVGLLVNAPYPRENAQKVLLTIDLTPPVLNEILEDQEIGAVMAYHPVIFRGLKRLSLDTPKEEVVMKCLAKGVSIYCPHTALDACRPGINDWLVSPFGQGSAIVVDKDDSAVGMGRIVQLETPMTFDVALEKVKKHLGLARVRIAKPYLPIDKIQSVAVCAGSGSSILSGVNADLYITGEMSHHDVLTAIGMGSHVILCEHTNTERGYLAAVLKSNLQQLFDAEEGGKVEVIVSKRDADPLEIS